MEKSVEKGGKRVYETLIYSVDDNGVAAIKLNRPKQGNSLVVPTGFEEVGAAFRQAGKDPKAKVVVFCSEGKHFCSGGDIGDMKRRLEEKIYVSEQAVHDAARVYRDIRLCEKPTIAMIQGACVGAGASLALGCDFRVMADVAYFGMAFINVALPGDTGGLMALYQMCGLAKTLEYTMLGDRITAEEAKQFGLAYKVTAPEDLRETTMALAHRLASGPRMAYRYQKKLLWDVTTAPMWGNYMEEEATGMVDCGRSADYTEAVLAFLNKRPPVYQGK